MLALDSLVIDLMFQRGAALRPETLFDALGGQEAVGQRQMLEPDMLDPRFEMELSPSRPFRQRDERRLMIIDDSVAPMREDPRADPLVPIDLRPEKERLIAACAGLPVRLGRLSALGTWGEAVLVARSAVDLRAWALLSWVLDPQLDRDGKRRVSPLTRSELEDKLMAYGKRLEELDEQAILANLHTATVERRGELLVVSVLEADGTWDVRNSLAMEAELAAIEQFSLMPGAPAQGSGASRPTSDPGADPGAGPTDAAAPAQAPRAPLRTAEVGGRVVLVFTAERFDLDVAAALGKRDYGAVISAADAIPGPMRDRIHRDGADFVAPLEFLSEVFLDGKPLSKPQFQAGARELPAGARGLDVHCPRFGPVLLVELSGGERYISSAREPEAEVVALLS
ncbi:hypothetical protein [Haliangium sp.]|uniref:hypothetical protein n=1 Tax=Haliangium sp. TaxID=2663208 RepID=UPI003D120BDB